MARTKKPQNPDLEKICSKGGDSEANREFLTRIGDKWTLLIIMILAHTPKHRARFSEIKNQIGSISQTMLTSTLRNLERDGLIQREVFPEVPPRVEYELTKLGESVLKPVETLIDWVNANWPTVKKSRERFDQKKK